MIGRRERLNPWQETMDVRSSGSPIAVPLTSCSLSNKEPILDQIYPLHAEDFCKTSFCKLGINTCTMNMKTDKGERALESEIFMGVLFLRENQVPRTVSYYLILHTETCVTPHVWRTYVCIRNRSLARTPLSSECSTRTTCREHSLYEIPNINNWCHIRGISSFQSGSTSFVPCANSRHRHWSFSL